MAAHSFDGTTLVEILRSRADTRPEVGHLVLLPDDGGPAEAASFGDLLEGAEAVARGLRARGVEPGQTVALMLPTSRDFFSSFAGILLAGAVPVPIYPPVRIDQIEEYADRQTGILRNAQAVALVTVRQARALASLLLPKVPSLETIVRADRLAEEGRRATNAPGAAAGAPTADNLALIQYTSGSTGDPKGVSLTHANLIANIRSIGEVVEVSEEDVVVSWLPLYHDMGLIGCWLFALCYGLPIVAFSPLAFLRRPKRWLRALSDYHGTLSPAPNFAYELCLRRIRDRDLEDIDLSSWRWALNGAEPIKPRTIDRFSERFRPYGFRPEALKPVYGLAENAVALTFPTADGAPRIDRVEREPFQRQRRAVPAEGENGASPEALAFVSVGRPIPGNEIRLVDDGGESVPERVEGQIEFRGPSATPGYFRNPEATAEIRTADGWTRTGDRGYLADGDLFISGRSKDMIIKAGRNIHPAEVEAVAEDVEDIRRGCVAAFGVPSSRTGSEDLVVVAETRKKDPEIRQRLASEVRRRVSSAIKVAPDAVELVPPRTVPKTPSGKLRRTECRDRFLNGALTPRRRPAWVQITRLGGAALGTYLLTRLWRSRAVPRADRHA
ncbi:MAG: fatty acyl-AMP ligase [bacterium]|nr:fatty acyl-AMP ligase [bacterium]